MKKNILEVVRGFSWALVLNLLIALPSFAVAAAAPVPNNLLPDPGLKGSTAAGGFVTIICNVAGWMFVFLIVLSVIFVIVAAFYYMTAGGEGEKISTAHRMIAYTAVAILVAVMARATPVLVSSITGVKIPAGC